MHDNAVRKQKSSDREHQRAYPRNGTSGGCDARDQTLGPGRVIRVCFPASELTNPQGSNTGNVGRGHAGTTQDLIAAVEVGAEDFGTWRRDIRLESKVKGCPPRGISGRAPTSGVEEADIMARVVYIEGGCNITPSQDRFDDCLSSTRFDHASDARGRPRIWILKWAIVVIEQDILRVERHEVSVLVSQVASPRSDENDLAR